jgi:hypothetical protein
MTFPAVLFVAGSLITSTATFANAAGSPADPSTITLKYRAGSGPTVVAVYPAPAITRVSAGVYQALLDTTGWAGPGDQLWAVQWSGTGLVQAIADSYWFVTPAAL